MPDKCIGTSLTSETLVDQHKFKQDFTITMTKLKDVIGEANLVSGFSADVCGARSVTVTDSAGNDVSSWISTAVDGSGNP